MNNLLQVILLGVIEGVTEFLPISSTGHLLIAEKLGEPRHDPHGTPIPGPDLVPPTWGAR